MQTLQELSRESKYVLTEPFASELRQFLCVLEGEWQQTSPLMNAAQQKLFKEAHQALGAINELQDGAQ